MSSKSIDKNILEIHNKVDRKKKYLSLKDLVVPFSEFGGPSKELFIYFGGEKIPFNERHPVYQAILKNEFAKSIRDLI